MGSIIINPENKFDYAKYGNYLFIEDELYITTDRPGYKSFDINNSFRQIEINKLLNNQSKYLIKGIFAGFDTLSRDIYNERIYYGDILKIDLMDEVLTREEFDLLSDKISNMTINEMAAVRDYSRETVRKKLKKISSRIKDKFN